MEKIEWVKFDYPERVSLWIVEEWFWLSIQKKRNRWVARTGHDSLEDAKLELLRFAVDEIERKESQLESELFRLRAMRHAVIEELERGGNNNAKLDEVERDEVCP